MNKKQAQLLTQFQAFLKQNDYQITEQRPIQHAVQFKISDGPDFCTVNIYTTAKMTVGGKAGALKTALDDWKLAHVETQAADKKRDNKVLPWPHIGADETGKGDYFGPLVTAAVYVTAETAGTLRKLGVRDSKALEDNHILALSEKIRATSPFAVRALMPPDYNARFDEQRNANVVLAHLHAQSIGAVSQGQQCRAVLLDQFAAPKLMAGVLAEHKLTLDLTQQTKAESDVAVAAASILARAAFVLIMQDYRRKSGLNIPLGASDPAIINIGRAIAQRWGPAGLARIAKMHFKTTQKILSTVT